MAVCSMVRAAQLLRTGTYDDNAIISTLNAEYPDETPYNTELLNIAKTIEFTEDELSGNQKVRITVI